MIAWNVKTDFKDEFLKQFKDKSLNGMLTALID